MSKEGLSSKPEIKQRFKAVGETAISNPSAFAALYLAFLTNAETATLNIGKDVPPAAYIGFSAASYLAIPVINALVNARKYDKAIRGKSTKDNKLRDESFMAPILWKAFKTGKVQKQESIYIDADYVPKRRVERKAIKEKLIFWRRNNSEGK